MEELDNLGKLDEAGIDRFTSWLTLITQKSIEDAETIRRICEREELKEAVKTQARLSSDNIKRQAYQRRLDELRTYNHVMEQIVIKDAIIADKDAEIAELKARLRIE